MIHGLHWNESRRQCIFSRFPRGRRAAAMLAAPARAVSLLRDPDIEHALDRLARPVLEAAGLGATRTDIVLVDDRSLNAFVVDRGTIFIHSGLLLKMDTAAMLQAVIAHEAAHIANGHLTRRPVNLRNARTAAGIGMALAAAAAVASGRARRRAWPLSAPPTRPCGCSSSTPGPRKRRRPVRHPLPDPGRGGPAGHGRGHGHLPRPGDAVGRPAGPVCPNPSRCRATAIAWCGGWPRPMAATPPAAASPTTGSIAPRASCRLPARAGLDDEPRGRVGLRRHRGDARGDRPSPPFRSVAGGRGDRRAIAARPRTPTTTS